VARARALTLVVAVLSCAAAACASAQTSTRLQPEVRADVLGPAPYRWQGGAGLTAALGYYARVTVLGGYTPEADARYLGGHWRGDVIARVLLDPFRQQRWGVSIGGGLSVRHYTYLAAVLDVEGPPLGGVLPAVQMGVGGGVREGIVLRRAMRGRR
jgi:hypothetical protein